MLSRTLEHKGSLVSTLEIANDCAGIHIVVTDKDWEYAEMMRRMLALFASAVEALESDCPDLLELPCTMAFFTPTPRPRRRRLKPARSRTPAK